MNQQQAVRTEHYAGPPLALLAILYTVLFNAGLYPVTSMRGTHWPGPWEPAGVITAYFQTHHFQVLTCIFLQLGATICLGLFTAAAVGQLRFLGVRSAGPWIALLGGFLTVFNSAAAGFITWTMIRPEVVRNPDISLAFNYLSYAFGGPGFSIPMGLLMAGISIPALLLRLMPRWIAILGIVLGVAGVLSWFHLISPAMLFLIPLVRFPGFIWILAVGLMLPVTRNVTAVAA